MGRAALSAIHPGVRVKRWSGRRLARNFVRRRRHKQTGCGETPVEAWHYFGQRQILRASRPRSEGQFRRIDGPSQRNRKAFPITIKSEKPIAKAEMMGLTKPNTARGTAAAL